MVNQSSQKLYEELQVDEEVKPCNSLKVIIIDISWKDCGFLALPFFLVPNLKPLKQNEQGQLGLRSNAFI